MNNTTRPQISAILNALPNRFDTHLVEKRFLRQYPVAFAEELLRFKGTADPLHQFSMAFGQWIDRTFANQIQQTTKITSENLGGDDSQNQEWEKIGPNSIS